MPGGAHTGAAHTGPARLAGCRSPCLAHLPHVAPAAATVWQSLGCCPAQGASQGVLPPSAYSNQDLSSEAQLGHLPQVQCPSCLHAPTAPQTMRVPRGICLALSTRCQPTAWSLEGPSAFPVYAMRLCAEGNCVQRADRRGALTVQAPI